MEGDSLIVYFNPRRGYSMGGFDVAICLRWQLRLAR